MVAMESCTLSYDVTEWPWYESIGWPSPFFYGIRIIFSGQAHNGFWPRSE